MPKVILLLLCGLLLLACADTAVAYTSACGISEAKQRVRAAERAVVRAQARAREARHVLRATKDYSARYGSSTGRWVWAARRTGWRWTECGTLFLVVSRESKGDPLADSGYYVGLLQFSPDWVTGDTDWRTDPKESLRRCLKSVREAGWVHWPTAL